MKLLWTLVLGFLIVVPDFAVYGQQTTGEVTGTVTDNSGAVIPGATVKATNNATQQVRTTASNASGNYVMPYLPPGTYTIECQGSGFKLARNTNVDVTVGAVVAVNFKMQVGVVTQQVTVTTATPLLSIESTAVETNIGNQQIVALPLNGRDYLSLVALSPNVENEEASGTGASGVGGLEGGVRSTEAISVAGQRLEFNHYTIDGVENTDPDFNSYIIHPSVDALQEFTVLSGVYSAEYGRGAGQINATTLPGTNAYHGVAFDYIRNGAADAELWRQVGKKNAFHRQDYGFVLDGPLSIPHIFNAKNKLFFASSFEDLGDHEGIQEFASVPTEAMRAGDFSEFGVPTPGVAPTGSQIPQLYFPTSQVAGATACPVSSGGSFNPTTNVCMVGGTNNVIPSSMISPIANTILGYEPLPNLFGGPSEEVTYANDYVAEAPQINDQVQFNQRIDFTQNSRSSWFGRFSWENDLDTPASVFGPITATQTTTTARQVVLGNTFVVSPHIVNEARFGWSQLNNSTASPQAGTSGNLEASFGITGLTDIGGAEGNGIPAMGWNELTGYGGVVPYITHDDLFQWLDSLSIVKGNHSITLGGMFERDRYNEFGNQFLTGAFGWSGFATENPKYSNPLTGFDLADMEFGYASGRYLRVSENANIELRRPDYAAFVEDDWKVRPSLTLNLGLRYDNTVPWIDKHNDFINAQTFTYGVNVPKTPLGVMPQATIIPNAQSPILTRPGAPGCNFYAGMSAQFAEPGEPVQCGDQYVGRSTVKPDNTNFGPRIGLDYALGTKWSFRSGFGIFYTQDYNNYFFDMGRNLGPKDGENSGSISTDLTPLASPWSTESANPACAANQYNGNATWTGLCLVGDQVDSTANTLRTPYVEQYILHVQRQLTQNVGIDVGYEGSESHHLDRYYLENQAVPKTGPNDTSSIVQRRPWPGLGQFQEMRDWDQANYNAGDVKLTQRLSHGLLYVIAFTWSRSLDYGSAVRVDEGDNLWPDDTYNPGGELGPSSFNMPRRFVASFVYSLPFGSGKEFAPSSSIVNHIVSGWTVGGILTLADGTSMNQTALGDTADMGGGGNRPEYVGLGPYKAAHPTPSMYWNPAAWVGAYTSPVLSYQEGSMSRTNLYTPGSEDFDSNLARTFHIWESSTLEARFEAFNTLNRPNWDPPLSSDPLQPTFGQITGAGPMRELQAALRYSF